LLENSSLKGLGFTALKHTHVLLSVVHYLCFWHFKGHRDIGGMAIFDCVMRFL
jgi:hypothetical protein